MIEKTVLRDYKTVLRSEVVARMRRPIEIITAGHETDPANKYENANNSWHFHIY